MGWLNLDFHCKTCDHIWEEIVHKEHGKDEVEMPKCPKDDRTCKEHNEKECKLCKIDTLLGAFKPWFHEVERGVPSFSGVYDVGYYGKSRRMK